LTFTKRVVLSWRILRLLPKLEFLDEALPELEAMQAIVPKLEALGKFLPKLRQLDSLIALVETMEAQLPDKDVLASITSKFIYLDEALGKIQSLGQVPTVVYQESNGHGQSMQATMIKDREIIHGWNRMKLLSKFALLASKSREIELEWQRIQQDEHDATFAFRSGRSNEVDASYKKGIADGVKWCVNRFS
jgi:hypothetical protein